MDLAVIPEVTPGQRLALFGGTFDPPHLGHLLVADTARRELDLHHVLWVPAARPYHKAGPAATFEERCAMLEAMLAERPDEVCPVERGRERPSYTVDLLARFGEKGWEPAQLYFLMGADSLRDLPKWKDCPRLFELGTLVAVTRPGYPLTSPDLAPDLLARVHRLEVDGRDVSSSALRGQLAAGDAAAHEHLHSAVVRWILDNGEYRGGA
jgi:nicotinate-nucleotide adenylyltransferase